MLCCYVILCLTKQLLWEKRIMHAKRLMAKESTDLRLSQLTKESDQNASIQVQLKAKLDKRQTAKRKLLLHYLAEKVRVGQLQELSNVDRAAMAAASAAAKEVEQLHGASAGATEAFTPTARTVGALPPHTPIAGVARPSLADSTPAGNSEAAAEGDAGAVEADGAGAGAGAGAPDAGSGGAVAREPAHVALAGCDLINSEARVVVAAMRACPNVGEVDLRGEFLRNSSGATIASLLTSLSTCGPQRTALRTTAHRPCRHSFRRHRRWLVWTCAATTSPKLGCVTLPKQRGVTHGA